MSDGSIHALSGSSVVLCCATAEEFEALAETLKKQKCELDHEVSAPFGPETLCNKYILCTLLPNAKFQEHTVLAFLGGSGPELFASTCTAALALLKPKSAVLVGVCASDKSAMKGQVLLSAEAFNYEEGKHTLKKSSAPPDPAGPEPDPAKGFLASRRPLQASAKADLDYYRRVSTLGAVFKDKVTFATGAAVRADNPKILQEAREAGQRDTYGLDMEASAFLRACTVAGVVCLGIVKTVLDTMDPSRKAEDANYKTCASASAEVAIDYAKWYIIRNNLVPSLPLMFAEVDGYVSGYLVHIQRALQQRGSTLLAPKEKFHIVIPKDGASLPEPQGITAMSWQDKITEKHRAIEKKLGGEVKEVTVEVPPHGTRQCHVFNGIVFDIPRNIGPAAKFPKALRTKALEAFKKGVESRISVEVFQFTDLEEFIVKDK